MAWKVVLARQAAKKLARVPERDRVRIVAALQEMGDTPWTGDIAKLHDERAGYRRRVGSYRIFFDVDDLEIQVVAIERRTSTTY